MKKILIITVLLSSITSFAQNASENLLYPEEKHFKNINKMVFLLHQEYS